jgi:hypothetical protein
MHAAINVYRHAPDKWVELNRLVGGASRDPSGPDPSLERAHLAGENPVDQRIKNERKLDAAVERACLARQLSLEEVACWLTLEEVNRRRSRDGLSELCELPNGEVDQWGRALRSAGPTGQPTPGCDDDA